MTDPYDLQRFVMAQDPVYEAVRTELRRGSKRTHWMWFVFPQLRGLGRSGTSYHYGIASQDEARAYWSHPVLGPRLRECIGLILAVDEKSALDIFAKPDDWKLGCCLTLFAAAVPDEPLFSRALDRFFDGHRNRQTLRLLAENGQTLPKQTTDAPRERYLPD